MQGYKSYEEKLFYTFRLSERVPVNNFYRRLKGVLDLSFIRKYTQEYYGKEGQTSIMNALALFRENPDPEDDEIKEYLAGNLCRCSGYEGQLRGIRAFLEYRKRGGAS